MKIGQFSDSFLPIVDGVGRVVYNYCDTLGRKGHEVSAIVPMQDMGYRGAYPFDIIDYLSVNMVSVPYNAGIPDIDPHFEKRLSMADFDIVHVHTPFLAGISGIRYARKNKIPVVGFFHSKYYDDFLQITGSKHLAEFGTDVIVRFYNRCDDVWTVSENSAETLRSYGYKKPVYVIQNGMDTKSIDVANKKAAKKHFGIRNETVLLYVGQMNEKKNVGRIIEAVNLLRKDRQDFKLILAGKGPHEKRYQKMVDDYHLNDKVIFTGHISDEDLLSGLYQLSDLFVFPSLYDTYSMVVREAAIVSTPSVVTRGSAPSECIKDKENGFICEDSSESLYEVISDCLKDKERLKKVGNNARKSIPVSWDEIIDEAVKRYEYVIHRYQEKHQ